MKARTNIINIWNGDPRLETLYQAVKDIIYERGQGLPVPSVVGVLEIIKFDLIEDLKADM